ncbi:hypothetical protein [Endozoicomonas euniceicola]|uniref:Uncharacterized protein n=1 Tax=Endozoicomonas euniceicola TaxID=1234143 RepID=A0ABY6GU71_9GAMM|nr:hypothetical protein [Endozoicomonas euniceicola]UYM15499.1 hypothetical protein NX720_22045 [Endozoicomonas euniceicola]
MSLGINPDQTAVKDCSRNRKFDKIYAITNKHPEWSEEVMRLIEYYKIRRSDQTAAEKLNQGTYAPVPLPPGCQAEKWTADILVGFIRTCKQTRKASVSKERVMLPQSPPFLEL